MCPGCGSIKAWELQTKASTWERAGCGRQTSVTAGTLMHHSKLPLTTWFWASYLMATHSNGISALQLQRQLALDCAENRLADELLFGIGLRGWRQKQRIILIYGHQCPENFWEPRLFYKVFLSSRRLW